MSTQTISPNPTIETVATPAITKSRKQKCKETFLKIWIVIKKILFGLVAGALYLFNPSIFAIGFVVGLVWSEKVNQVVQKVVNLCKAKPWLVCIILFASAVISLPVALSTVTIVVSGKLGAFLIGLGKKDG